MSGEPVWKSWHRRYPARWRRELAALRERGWSYRVRYERGAVELSVAYMGAEVSAPVRLVVRYPDGFPWFAPRVFDRRNGLGLVRHREPRTGQLCLVRDVDWHVDRTAAELIEAQVPVVVAWGRPRPEVGGGVPVVGVEELLPAPTAERLGSERVAVTVPSVVVPTGLDGGVLVLRSWVTESGITAMSVAQVLGEGFSASSPLSPDWLAGQLPSRGLGWWLRVPDFDVCESERQVWERVRGRLPALKSDGAELSWDPERLQVVGLLVPSEIRYGVMGERWVFLLRWGLRGGSTRSVDFLDAQEFGDVGPAVRVPVSSLLARKFVTVVGVGAVGSVVATDLVRSGVGTMRLIDPDVVDVSGSGTRQPAPFIAAGDTKARALAGLLRMDHPLAEVRGYSYPAGAAAYSLTSKGARVGRSLVDRAVRDADLVVDATASPAVTRWLAARRWTSGRGFLTVSGTAGGWGGVVFLQTPASGCWACVEHARADGLLPVPPEDAAGAVEVPGCSSPTFTGTSADMGTVAHHASRVAVQYLTAGVDLGGDYFVAALRDGDGFPQPVSWRKARVAVHPECPLHSPAAIARQGRPVSVAS